MTLDIGQWVRLPKQTGYAEGIIDNAIMTGLDVETVWAVRVPPLDGFLYCQESWLTPIEEPRIPADAPQMNISPEGHPMVDHHPAQVSLVVNYIRAVEQGQTDKVCWCPWTPMTVNNKVGRLRTGEHPQCPLHTKEGFLHGFIAHVRHAFTTKRVDGLEFIGPITDNIEAHGGIVTEAKASVRWLE